MKMGKQIVPRPVPTAAAVRGLKHLAHVEAAFDGGRERDQDAAVDYLAELVDWWRLPGKHLGTKPKR